MCSHSPTYNTSPAIMLITCLIYRWAVACRHLFGLAPRHRLDKPLQRENSQMWGVLKALESIKISCVSSIIGDTTCRISD